MKLELVENLAIIKDFAFGGAGKYYPDTNHLTVYPEVFSLKKERITTLHAYLVANKPKLLSESYFSSDRKLGEGVVFSAMAICVKYLECTTQHSTHLYDISNGKDTINDAVKLDCTWSMGWDYIDGRPLLSYHDIKSNKNKDGSFTSQLENGGVARYYGDDAIQMYFRITKQESRMLFFGNPDCDQLIARIETFLSSI